MTKSDQPVVATDIAQLHELSPIGQYLVKNRDKILDEYCHRLRLELKGASKLSKPILINTVPAFIDNLAEVLTTGYPRRASEDNTSISEEHGGERARMTLYNPEDLIREYQIFKEVISESLEENFKLTTEDRLNIQVFVDSSLRDAATTFALVQSELREQFIAILTHDLRSPIGTIKMAAELLFDELENKSQARMLIGRIIDNARRADAMIKDLLDSTVIRSGGRLQLDISECRIMEIIKSVVQEFSITHGVKINVLGKDVIGYWSADYLRRALDNLCSNAVKYGNKNSDITIQVGDAHERIFISVHNEGTPIPAAEQETIFQVYRRAHAAKSGDKRGWGIGLRLVRGVAESHGGSVVVDSCHERGTTFTIDIPIDARPFQNAPVVG